MDDLEAASKFLDLDGGCIPEFGIVALAHINQHGQRGYAYAALGKPDVLVVAGLMEIVRHEIFDRAE